MIQRKTQSRKKNQWQKDDYKPISTNRWWEVLFYSKRRNHYDLGEWWSTCPVNNCPKKGGRVCEQVIKRNFRNWFRVLREWTKSGSKRSSLIKSNIKRNFKNHPLYFAQQSSTSTYTLPWPSHQPRPSDQLRSSTPFSSV